MVLPNRHGKNQRSSSNTTDYCCAIHVTTFTTGKELYGHSEFRPEWPRSPLLIIPFLLFFDWRFWNWLLLHKKPFLTELESTWYRLLLFFAPLDGGRYAAASFEKPSWLHFVSSVHYTCIELNFFKRFKLSSSPLIGQQNYYRSHVDNYRHT